MTALRFVLVGGFLGAGKTTVMARLGRHYRDQGLKVGLVTNDQAEDLVDTKSLAAQGFPVEEVAGACFCCKFDELVDKVGKLGANRPDVIIAEPVGSCTDLVATVVQPLRDIYRDQFRVAPYGVLFKPSHGLRILRNEGGGFSPKAAYIFRKQLEEADVILINRLDELPKEELDELMNLLQRDFPGTPVLALSAKTGQNFDAFAEFLNQDGAFGRKILDIDYDTYAEGEAELGWLNSSVHIEATEKPVEMDALLLDIVSRLQAAFGTLGAEIAHLKAIGLGEISFGVANLVSSKTKPELSLASQGKVTSADIIVNARAAGEPKDLEEAVRKTVAAACQAHGCTVEFRTMQSFRPGRPQPTHRYAAAR